MKHPFQHKTQPSVVLTFSSWWWSEHHWRETGSSSCGWKPSRCWALRWRLPARRASSATGMMRPEGMAAETQWRFHLHQHSAQDFCPRSCLALTLILPNSICFWMVYICSVLSILLAPSLQLLTNCWTNNHHSHITVLLWRDDKVPFPPDEPLSTSLPCSWRAATTRRQSTRLFCPLFSGILSAVRTRRGNVFSKSDIPDKLRSLCGDGGGEEKVNQRPAAAAAWWLSAWGGWGRRSWAGLHTHCCLRCASGSLWRQCCCSWENRFTAPCCFQPEPEDFGKNTRILTAASAASSAGTSHWSNRRCRAQNDWKRGFEQCR